MICPFSLIGRRPIGVALLFFLCFALPSLAQDIARTFLKGPYLQAPGAKTMTIIWESPTNHPGLLRYGLSGQLTEQARLEMPRELVVVTTNSVTNVTANVRNRITRVAHTNRVYLYEVTLNNLRPNSVYGYSAETDGVRTPSKKFKTFGTHPNKVTFIAYGDTRTNPKIHAAIAANFRKHAPDFILHTGDLVAAGKRHDLWGREFFGPLANVIDEFPMLPAIGNHEEDGLNYLHYLHLPGKERWYSYDVGPVHMLALDYHFEKATDEQFLFAKQDLMASSAPWKIVFLHYPVFNIGGHGTGWGHEAYLPLFHKAKVDLLVTGHSHIYERFRPIASKTGTNTWPITHITTGGGGAPLYVTYTHPALAAFVATNHYVVIEATPTRLNGRALTTNDAVIDTFELRKLGGRPPPKYMAQIYPEDALKLAFDVSPILTGALASVPRTNSTAQIMFTVRPLKTTKHPVELAISLTTNSAPYYELVGGPLQVISPSATESNKVVWATVRTTGRQRITSDFRSRELTPALIFRANMVSDGTETVAYGEKCKVTSAATSAAKKLADAEQPK